MMNAYSLRWIYSVILVLVAFRLGWTDSTEVVGVFFPGTNEILYQDITINELKSFYLLENQIGPNALALDTDGILSSFENTSKIYFSVSSPSASIYRCNLLDRCSGLQKVYDAGVSQTISGIALDFVNSKMYWVESGTLKKANPDGSNIQTLLSGLQDPNKIAVDPTGGHVYFSLPSKNSGNSAGQGVGKCTLSGSDFTTILASNLQNAQGVAFDTLNNTLYITDSSKDVGVSASDGNEKILSSNDTGGSPATVTSGNMAIPAAASLYINDTTMVKVLYWIDSQQKTVNSYDLSSDDRAIVFAFSQNGGSDLALHIANTPLNLTMDQTTASSTDTSTLTDSSSANSTTSGSSDNQDSKADKGLLIAAITIPILCVVCFGVTATGVFIRKRKDSQSDSEPDVEKVENTPSSNSVDTLQGGVSTRSKESHYDDLAMQRNTIRDTNETPKRTPVMQMESISNTSDLSLPGAYSTGNSNVISSSHSNSNVQLPGSNENSEKDRALSKSKSGYLYSAKVKNSYEINVEELQFGKELGRGAYGVVYLGEYRHQKVAIKKLLRTDLTPQQIEEFKEEGLLMSALPPHKNVVTTLGVCVSKELCIVTEYLPMGSLLAYLRHAKIDNKRIIRIGKDIAAGMAHLAREGIVHRDLAARNLLMTESLEIKISDFGMARVLESEDDTSGKTESTTGPLKWMAPECISQRQYSTKSDVWAFGITMIEILTKEIPYPGESPVTICIKVVNGHKHQIPETCPVPLATLIDQCWAFEPQKRPDFDTIFTTLEKMKL